MSGKDQEHVVIIGNGIAGITAARHIRKNSKAPSASGISPKGGEKKITVISAESDYFFARTALMYVFMGHMTWKNIHPYEDWFWEKNRIELKKAFVTKVDTDNKTLLFEGGEELKYDTLILATGSVPRKLGWEGEDLKGVQGLVSKQDLELLEENSKNCKRAVIVGGGLIGVEFAEMLHTRKIEVTIIIREDAFWGNVLPKEDAEFISHHIKSHGITLLHNTKLEKIVPDEDGNVKSVITNTGKEIPCELVGLSVGVKPNISFLKGSKIETNLGILVNRKLQTNIENVYAIGDCAQQREPIGDRTSVEAIWYTARMMGETVAQTICGNPFEYNPGNWFNSAKFFEIEYQTYGRVWETPRKDEQHLHWEHKDKTKALTVAFNSKTNQFFGINTFGIRMRHEVFDQWLSEGKSVEFVLSNLKKANFDAEFYDKHEKEIFNSFKNSLYLTNPDQT